MRDSPATAPAAEAPLLVPVNFHEDPSDLYARLADLHHPVMLDSGGYQARGHWDIVAAQPTIDRSLTLLPGMGDAELHRQLERWTANAERHCTTHRTAYANAPSVDLPFHGGYIGHLSYELGRRLHGFEAADGIALPLASVHYYPWAVLQDRRHQRAMLVSDGSVAANVIDEISCRVNATSLPKPVAHTRAQHGVGQEAAYSKTWSLADYAGVFERVKDYIRAGDCYQINIGQAFNARLPGSMLDGYRALRGVAAAPYSALVPLAAGSSLLCFSPERFLGVNQGKVVTSPIKGTRPRSTDPELDKAAAQTLLASEKERAENLMIVDLLRNDLGRFCTTGSVRVDALFDIESYATVHHLVSTVSGVLKPETSPLRLLLGCMPGGSITGAPKHRAMQIIDELEAAPRQSWCGTVFYWSRHGRLDSNITIRSLFEDPLSSLSESQRSLICWAGGGLVDGSELLAEYEEQEHKVHALLAALAANTRATPGR